MASRPKLSSVKRLDNTPPLPEGLDGPAMVKLYREMVLLRRFELAAQVACRSGETPGFLHLYIGEEAVAVGVMPALQPSDAVVATYREHGQALARGVAMGPLMAEMYGKQEGCSRGRGGSMHVFSPPAGGGCGG